MSRIMVGVMGAIAAVVLVGAFFRLFDAATAPPIVIADPPVLSEIVVAVDGAVATPGLYHLPGDARHGDAITAAGGLSEDADPALVNPARRLHDEERLVVPSRSPTTTPAIAGGSPVPREEQPGDSEAATTGPSREININTASAKELEALPGIGPTLAERIVARRSERGPYRTVEELDAIEGISPRLVEELRPLVTVSG